MCFVNVYCIFFCLVSYVSAQNETASYEGAQLWHTAMQSVADIVLIKKLIDNLDVDSWNLNPSRADYIVRPENVKKVLKQLGTRNLGHDVIMTNIQRSVDDQLQGPALWNENTLRLGHRLSWSAYPPLHIIEEYYNFLDEEYPSLCKVQTIGRTAENRTIKMINITNGNPNNKIMIIIGGVHGREWISITSALYILDNIVSEYDQLPDSMKAINWLIIPLVNPDGYEFTITHNRLWRKNRRRHITCNGADINRNFEIDWGVAGVTENNECKDAYAGPYPFSEPETVAVRNLITSLPMKASALIDIHAYGNSILYPWSARAEKSRDLDLHIFTAGGMTKAIMDKTGETYTHGPTYHKVYPATGSLLDWAYSQGIKHTYVIEGRDNGHYGFLLPPEEIKATGQEIYAAVAFLANVIDPQILQRSDRTPSWF